MEEFDEIVIDGKDIESVVVEDEYGNSIENVAITESRVFDVMWIDENAMYNLSECKIRIRLKKDRVQIKR